MTDQAHQAKPSEPVRLPSWINEARKWHEATVRLAEALEREDKQVSADLRQVRGMRRLIDAVLERVDAGSSGT